MEFKPPKSLAAVMLCFLSTLLAGCLGTQVRPQPVTPGISRLSAVNERPLRLAIQTDPAVSQTIGHQFLLLVIPFGAIELQDPGETVRRAAIDRLAIAGRTAIPFDDRLPGRSPVLKLELADASLSAFDLLFFRRVTATIRMRAELRSPDGSLLRTWTSNRSYGEARKFGFERDLSAIFEKTLRDALDEIIKELRL